MKRACELLGHHLHVIVTNALGFWWKDHVQNADKDMDDDPETDLSLASSTIDSIEISKEQESGIITNPDDEETEKLRFSHFTSFW